MDIPVEGKLPFQYPKATDNKTKRKLTKDVSDYRKAELEEYPWVENEWNGMGDSHVRRDKPGRFKPINQTRAFDEERIPHIREYNERPFD